MLNQTQTQPQIQSHQEEQISNPYPNTQIKDSNLGLSQNSKYSSQRPYQSQMDFRNSSNRERSRSNDHSPRSFNDNRPGQNNYNMYNRNNRMYYNRDNNDRQFDSNKYRKERNQYGELSGEYNSNYGPIFGSGHELLISNNFLNGGSSTNFGHSYQDTSGKGRSIFTGDANNNNGQIKIKELEVFKLYK